MNSSKSGKLNRRNFIKGSSLGIIGGACALGATSPLFLRSKTPLLRPPGALDEKLFLASCIKCGQCLQVCPPEVISLAGLSEGFGIGTPYIVPQEGACILCEGLPCVLACPTGSLDHHISEGKEAKMGLAVITRPDSCLSIAGINDIKHGLKQLPESNNNEPFLDLLDSWIPRLSEDEKNLWKEKLAITELNRQEIERNLNKENIGWLIESAENSPALKVGCRICLTECPIKDENPIVFELGENEKATPIVQQSCVGCGVCEEKCPTTAPSIEITPRLQWEPIT